MKSSPFIITLIVAAAGYLILAFLPLNLSSGLAFALGAIVSGLIFTLQTPKALSFSNDIDANDADGSSRTLYVGNLPYRANESDVKALFESHGEVFAVRLMKDRRTGKRRGFGFVVMKSQDADNAVRQLNDSDYGNRKLKVREANEPKHGENEEE
uniref:RNA recognition motif domain-containing protein n=1 Tax=Thaumasiovibrio occultus TaxID=1891184 RepID=UPI000B352385|nr:RNA-binding protein [Thaumasiovibrio occultus]